MAKVKNKKTGAKSLSCQDCIHEWACSMQCYGNAMRSDNANRCACYEDVKGSAAYFIGYTDGKNANSNGAVDAVEVVRCKDCVRGHPELTSHFDKAWCVKFGRDMDINGFCSLGERKDGE